MKCENVLTDIPSYYSYVHVQYLLGAISIFLFSVVINGRDAFLQICTFLASRDAKAMTKADLYNSSSVLLSSIRYQIGIIILLLLNSALSESSEKPLVISRAGLK